MAKEVWTKLRTFGKKHVHYILLLILFLILVSASLYHSCTIDETTYTYTGYAYVTSGRLDLNPEHPPLAKWLIGLSEYLYEKLFNLPHTWHECIPSKLLVYRFPIMLMSLALSILVYKWSYELFGKEVALLTLLIYVLSPNLLAHSMFATIDLTCTFFFFFSVYSMWKFFSQEKYKQTDVRLGSFFLLILVTVVFSMAYFEHTRDKPFHSFRYTFPDSYNFSGTFNQFLHVEKYHPATYVSFISEKPLIFMRADDCIEELRVNGKLIYSSDCYPCKDCEGRTFEVVPGSKVEVKVKNFIGVTEFSVDEPWPNFNSHLILVAILLILVSAYFFKWPTLVGLAVGLSVLSKITGVLSVVLFIFYSLVFLLKGGGKNGKNIVISSLLALATAFLVFNLGYGFKTFDFYDVFGLRLPFNQFYLNTLTHALSHSAYGHKAYLMGKVSQHGWLHYFVVAFLVKTPLLTLVCLSVGSYFLLKQKNPIYFVLFLFLPFLLIFTVYSLSRINIGIRYVLPAYPFVITIAGFGSSKLIRSKNFGRLMIHFMIFQTAYFLTVYPHYLSYFNVLIRSTKGYLFLSDSNLDWGQDIWLLGEFSKEHMVNCGPLFGYLTPNLRCQSIVDCDSLQSLRGYDGYLAVSIYEMTVGGKCSWLLNYEPDERIGYSIFLYNIRRFDHGLR